MKKTLLAITFIGSAFMLNAQTAITLLNTEMRVGGLSTEIVYYGFEAGDKVTLTYSVQDGKDLKEIEIFEYPSNSQWTSYKGESDANTISISQKGIYGFRFKNGGTSKRYVDVKIDRLPGSSATQSFNSDVVWRSVTDTTFYMITEQYVTDADTTLVDIYNSNVNLQKFATNFPYLQVVEATLPANTEYWGYYFGVGNSGKLAVDLADMKMNEADDALNIRFSNYDPIYAEAFGQPSYLEDLKGNNNVELSFISDQANVDLFRTNQPYAQYMTTSGEVIAGRVTAPNSGKVYIGMVNRHSLDAIDVKVRLVAVQIVRTYATREVEKFNTNTYSKPFHAGE